MVVDMRKIETQAPGLVSFVKKAQFGLSKHGLDGQVAKVALVLDRSVSANELYSGGSMQRVAEKILALATQFDDDGAIDVFFFHNSAWYAGELSIENYAGGIDRLLKNARAGGTNYSAAFDAVTEHYFGGTRKGLFGKKVVDTSVPVYVAFLTDGATQDEHKAKASAQKSSERPIFFQSVGLGDPRQFGFISTTLNNHGGRVDNFGFFTNPDISAMKDMDLLDGLLNEFPGALRSMRAAGTLT